MVLFRSVVCVVEGGSLVEVVRTNVAKWSEGGEIMIIGSSKLYCTLMHT